MHCLDETAAQQFSRDIPDMKWERQIQLPLVRYDTTRDAILTCAQKRTRVSLIYRTEPTTEKWKTEKRKKCKKRICSEVTVKVWGIHAVSPKEKERLRWEEFEEKEKVLSLE